MRKILTILFLLSFTYSFGQPVNGRSNASVTVMDSRWMAQYNMFIPRYADTIAATLQKGIDSCGAVIFTYADSGKVYVRKCFPTKYWALISGGGGGAVTSSNGLTGTTNIVLGGSTLTQYSAIGLNGFPLSVVHNGVSNSAQSDSNSVRLSSNTTWVSATDSIVSPALILKTTGRKTIGGVATQPVSFMIDVLGKSGGAAAGDLRIRGSVNGVAYSDLLKMTNAGILNGATLTNGQNPINVNGARLGSGVGGTFFGSQALDDNSLTGAFNVAIGSTSMTVNTTGNKNVAVGDNTLGSNTTGTFNLALGFNALASNVLDSFNTAVGANALLLQTSGGGQNAAFGYNALTTSTSGFKNTAIGTSALELNTIGGFNTGVGHDVMLHNTTGSQNVAQGWLGGSLNATGSDNVSIGTSSARSVALANQSVFVGSESGYLDLNGAATQEDTVTNSIAIGYRSYTTASNQMRLGNPNLSSTFIYGARVGTTADSVYLKSASDGSLKTIAQSSLVGVNIYNSDGTTTGNRIVTNGANTLDMTWNTNWTSSYGMQLTTTATDISASGIAKLLNVRITGNQTGATISYAGSFSNSHTTAGGVNVGIDVTGSNSGTTNVGGQFVASGTGDNTGIKTSASGGTTNTAFAATAGSSVFGSTSTTAGLLGIIIPTSTATTTASGVIETMNSLTTGTGVYGSTTSLTSGNMYQYVSTSTALAAGNEMVDISMSGTNGTNAITATGMRISVTNANATSGTNVGLDVTATGATTANVAAQFTAPNGSSSGLAIRVPASSGRVAIGQASANAALDVVGSAILDAIATTSTAGNGSFYVSSATGFSGSATTGVQLLGSSTVDFRTLENGTTATTGTTGRPYFTHIIGASSYTEPGSGTITAVGSLALRAPTITAAAGAVTDGATLYVEGRPVATTTNMSMAVWVDAGIVAIDDTLALGTRAPSAQLHTTGTVRFANFGAGTATFAADGTVSSVSDGRLKFILRPYGAGLNEILKLDPIVYKWRPISGMETEHEYAGLDAREVHKIFGDLGTGINKEGYYSLQDRAIISALINSVKELNLKIEKLQKQINRYEKSN